MNRLSFSQKNDLVVKYKSKKNFGKDLELFQKHLPSHRLMNELARANSFQFEALDGQMIYLLLEKLSIQEIVSNREEKPADEIVTTPAPVVEELKILNERIQALEDSKELNEDEIQSLRLEMDDKDASIEDLQSKIEALEKKAVKKKD